MAGDGMVVLASIFRDATDHIPQYFEQVNALREHVPVTLCIAEGDSTDDTYRALKVRMSTVGDQLVKIDHGGPKFGSEDVLERWQNIAKVCNGVLDAAPRVDEPLIYVESDLAWEPDTMLGLLADIEKGFPAVSPMSMHRRNDRFYDCWGYRAADGTKFDRWDPYHWRLDPPNHMELSSAGSCVVISSPLWHHVRFGDDDCIVGLGRSIREEGGSLWLNPNVQVIHP